MADERLRGYGTCTLLINATVVEFPFPFPGFRTREARRWLKIEDSEEADDIVAESLTLVEQNGWCYLRGFQIENKTQVKVS